MMMKFHTLNAILLLLVFSHCNSLEIISLGLTSNSELHLFILKKMQSDRKEEINIRAFQILEEEDLKQILSDENNQAFSINSDVSNEDLNFMKYEYYLISLQIPEERTMIDFSKYRTNIGMDSPEKTISYLYDYIVLSRYRHGIAGSYEAMAISVDTFPLKHEKNYNHRNKASTYGYAEVHYTRTIRFICIYDKDKVQNTNIPLVFKESIKWEAKFSRQRLNEK